MTPDLVMGCDQRHETHVFQPLTAHTIVGAHQQPQLLCAGLTDRDHQSATRRQLLNQRRRNGRGGRRDDDGIVRRSEIVCWCVMGSALSS